MTAPLRVRRDRDGGWSIHCRHCRRQLSVWSVAQRYAIDFALCHLRTHNPVLCDAIGVAAWFGPAAVWCPLCDQRIANGLAEDEARHVAAEHWDWHLGRTT